MVDNSVITYSAAISACEKGQIWQIALGLLAEMAFVKVDQDVIACALLEAGFPSSIQQSQDVKR